MKAISVSNATYIDARNRTFKSETRYQSGFYIGVSGMYISYRV
jgi:hypothetical protein